MISDSLHEVLCYIHDEEIWRPCRNQMHALFCTGYVNMYVYTPSIGSITLGRMHSTDLLVEISACAQYHISKNVCE